MIPDKIYIRHYWMPGELDDEWRLKPVEDEQCEEYFRKDFIKAEIEKKIKELPEDWNGSDAAKWAYIDILNLIDIKSAQNN